MDYENEKCQFNFPGCEKNYAAYQRKDDSGQLKDACNNCVRHGLDKQPDPEIKRQVEIKDEPVIDQDIPEVKQSNKEVKLFLTCERDKCNNQFPRTRGRYPQRFCLKHRS